MMNRPESKISSLIVIIASLIGLMDCIYLSYIKLTNTAIYCTPGLGHCDVVNSSQWSELWGIPLAIYGIIGYSILLFLAVFGNRIKILAPYAELLLFATSLAGFLFSLYLTYLELFVIKAICQWCVLSALMMTVIFFTIIYKLVVKSAQFTTSGGN
jgi:uncharacterized membrane protein